MKVAHVTPVYPPRGGIGTVAQEYAQQLRVRGDRVTVFTPKYDLREPTEEAVWLKGVFHWGNAAVVPELVGKLRGHDVIHLHYPFYGGAVFALIASVLWKIPLVATYHMKTRAGGWLGLIFFLHRWLVEPFILWRASAVLISSNDYAESINFSHPRLQEQSFGVDTDRFSPGRAPHIRKRHDIPDDAFVFLFVGGMDDAHYFKGVPGLLSALNELPEDENWHALFVGGGNKLAEYQRLVQELGLADRVHFAGRVPHEELSDYYRAADLHLLPSTDRSEAYGLVTLEAAASGLPSVVSDLPGVRTLVAEHTGWVVPPGNEKALANALKTALLNRDLVGSMGPAARTRVLERYSLSVTVDKLQSVYRRVRVESV